jgi:hypothetical protein
VKEPVPPQLNDRFLFAVGLETADETVMFPELSKRTLPVDIAVTRSEALISTVTPEEFAWTSPSRSTPPLVGLPVMFIAPGMKDGVIVKVVPTNASAVTVSVRDPFPTFDVKPSSAKVAIPPSVRTVTEVTAVPEFPTLST